MCHTGIVPQDEQRDKKKRIKKIRDHLDREIAIKSTERGGRHTDRQTDAPDEHFRIFDKATKTLAAKFKPAPYMGDKENRSTSDPFPPPVLWREYLKIAEPFLHNLNHAKMY